MEINYELLTQVSSGAAFILVTFIGFFIKYRKDKKDDTSAIEKNITKAAGLNDVVKTLALELTEVHKKVDSITYENISLKQTNTKFLIRIEELETVIEKKYPDALKTIREFRKAHPNSLVEIPLSIKSDLVE